MNGGAAGDKGAPALWLWRHPRPVGAEGRCIGRTDLPVDARRVRRLAYRIRRAAQRGGLPREVWTSPLQRCAGVGRALARLGFVHRVDERLLELDFGVWDGRPWSAIAAADFAPWDTDFMHHAPGGGETVAALRGRVRSFCEAMASRPVLVVAHAGWMNALRTLDKEALAAADWPRPPGYGEALLSPNPCRSTAGPRAGAGTPRPAPGSPRAA
jgi:alpha-ribazole phosphatase